MYLERITMTYLFFILLALFIFYYFKSRAQLQKQTLLTGHYLRMLMLSCRNKEDFKNLLSAVYEYDSNGEYYGDFNKVWQTICDAAKVKAPQITYGSTNCIEITPQTMDTMVENIYDDSINKRYIKAIRDWDKFPKGMKKLLFGIGDDNE